MACPDVHVIAAGGRKALAVGVTRMASKSGGLNGRNDKGCEMQNRSEVTERVRVVADTFGTLSGRPMS